MIKKPECCICFWCNKTAVDLSHNLSTQKSCKDFNIIVLKSHGMTVETEK